MHRFIIILALIVLLAACGEAPTVPPATKAAATAAPTSAPAPTNTAAPAPTATTAPPTATAVPTTATSVPPTPTAIPATATTAPTSAPVATATRVQPTPFPIGKVLSFTASPTVTNAIGDPITLTWQATGQKAKLCPLAGNGPVLNQCIDVPLSGSRTINVTEADLQWVGYVLSAQSGDLAELSSVRVYMQCRGLRDWFMPNPPLRCPADVAQSSPAAFQRFERGVMAWTQKPDTFYVFYDSNPRMVEMFSNVKLKPGASPDNRTGETPPAGRFEPVSGFGMLWRGELVDIASPRTRLGWATEKEFAFTSNYQCELSAFPKLWNCYLGGPNGAVYLMRPDSTAGVNVLWEPIGTR